MVLYQRNGCGLHYRKLHLCIMIESCAHVVEIYVELHINHYHHRYHGYTVTNVYAVSLLG